MQFLRMDVYAPLASWGDIAVGEVRESWDRPSRSAVLGMVAAALGITRDAQPAHDELDTAFGLAVRVVAAGVPVSDYHTAQTAAAAFVREHRPATRRELLAADELQTILSTRKLRQDACWAVVLWNRASARWSLDELARSLARPAFVIYAGRKANALGLPLDARVVEGETLAAAFAPESMALPEFSALRPIDGWGREVSHDRCEGFASGLESVRTELRRDAQPNRLRWQFSERIVEVGLLPPNGL